VPAFTNRLLAVLRPERRMPLDPRRPGSTDSISTVDELGFGHGMTSSTLNCDSGGTTTGGLMALAVLDLILLSTAPTLTAHDIARSCHARQSRSRACRKRPTAEMTCAP
jgi:hypothetical protein